MGRRPHMSLARLTELPGEELKAEWARRYGASAPNLSAELLRLGLSYKLQEQKLGGCRRRSPGAARESPA